MVVIYGADDDDDDYKWRWFHTCVGSWSLDPPTISETPVVCISPSLVIEISLNSGAKVVGVAIFIDLCNTGFTYLNLAEKKKTYLHL